MSFKIGDRVEALDDVMVGTIVEIVAGEITVESNEGFDLQYTASELVKVSGIISVSNYDVAKIKLEKEIPKKRKAPVFKSKERNAPKMEVDLHVQKLTKAKNLSNYEMLNLQVDTAKRQLNFAISKRIQKVVFIHGVGDGVLKEELMYLFKNYENIKYYDADYQKYGLGATEVYILQNKN